MIRILATSPAGPNSTGMALVAPLECLGRTGEFKVKVLVLDESPSEPHLGWFSSRIEWEYLGKKPNLFRLRKCVAKSKADIHYAADGSMAPWALLGGMTGSRIPFVYHQQNFFDPRFTARWRTWAEKQCLRRANLVAVNERNRSQCLFAFHKLPYDASRVVVVPTLLPTYAPTAAVARQTPETAPNNGAARYPRFLHIGVPGKTRAGEEFFRALASIPGESAFTFTGAAPDSDRAKAVIQLAERCGYRGAVRCLGFLDFDGLMAACTAADFAILLYCGPSIGDHFQCPGRLSQYLRGGLPVLMHHSPYLELLECKYRIGVTCDSQKKESILSGLKLLIDRFPVADHACRSRICELAQTELSLDPFIDNLAVELRRLKA